MPYTGSKAAVLGYGTVVSIGPLASSTGTPTYVPINEVNDLSFPPSKRSTVMVTNFNSPSGTVEKRGVALDFGTLTFKTNYVPDDPGQMAIATANVAGGGAPYLFKLALSVDTEDGETTAGPVATFAAIITECGGFDVSTEKVSEGAYSLDITGGVTWTVGS